MAQTEKENNTDIEAKKTTKPVSVARYSFSGPLPHPRILGEYEKISTGTADRIIKMAEEQSAHRRSLEKDVINSNIKNERLGMHYSLVLSIVILVGGILLILNDKDAAGYISILSTLGFHGFNYFYQKKQESEEAEQRTKEDEE